MISRKYLSCIPNQKKYFSLPPPLIELLKRISDLRNMISRTSTNIPNPWFHETRRWQNKLCWLGALSHHTTSNQFSLTRNLNSTAAPFHGDVNRNEKLMLPKNEAGVFGQVHEKWSILILSNAVSDQWKQMEMSTALGQRMALGWANSGWTTYLASFLSTKLQLGIQ